MKFWKTLFVSFPDYTLVRNSLLPRPRPAFRPASVVRYFIIYRTGSDVSWAGPGKEANGQCVTDCGVVKVIHAEVGDCECHNIPNIPKKHYMSILTGVSIRVIPRHHMVSHQ